MRRAVLASALLVFMTPPLAAGQDGVEIGLLDCVIEGGTGFIFGSTKTVRCTFEPADRQWTSETYFGVLSRLGLDIGYTEATLMRWAVLAVSRDIYAPGALAGDYVGAGAEVTAAIGAGANLLIGGSGRTFTLQPLSMQSRNGLNLAVGVSQFQLRSTEK